MTYLIPRGWQEVHSRENATIQAKRAVVLRHWWSLALIFQAWPHTLILRSSLRRGVNMRSQCPSSYAREVPKTILILVWIGLPLENWCMCVCIVWIRYLELMITVWLWIKPFDDGMMSEERGETKNQPHWDFQAVLNVKQGMHWCLLAIEVKLWTMVYES